MGHQSPPGSLAERAGAEPDLQDSSGAEHDSECHDSASPLDTRGKHPLSLESVKAGSSLMVSSRDLYSIVVAVEKLGIG